VDRICADCPTDHTAVQTRAEPAPKWGGQGPDTAISGNAVQMLLAHVGPPSWPSGSGPERIQAPALHNRVSSLLNRLIQRLCHGPKSSCSRFWNLLPMSTFACHHRPLGSTGLERSPHWGWVRSNLGGRNQAVKYRTAGSIAGMTKQALRLSHGAGLGINLDTATGLRHE